MSSPPSWRERKQRLWELLDLEAPRDEDEGRAIDAYFLQQETLHGKETISEFNNLRFTNRDLSNFGPLAHGPFGSVDMVRCKLDNKLYVRKSVEKKVVARNPSQCYPYHERDILLAATNMDSPWAPHLLCTFQTHANLCYIMDFAEGGSLGDLLETSGQIAEQDLKWWLPQMVVAINWCHSQGFCHRDIKPSNFVVTSTGHLLLIDFASSARLLPSDPDGVQLVPKESCLVLCGTCDYISPEILAMQEDALVAFDEQGELFVPRGEGGYGRETDWWSLGATVFELVYGVAPFFSNDIRGTYDLIINHERKLRFPSSNVSPGCVSLIAGLLRTCTRRLGRKSIDEITSHRFLADVAWARLHQVTQPPGLQLPQFEYDLPAHSIQEDHHDESFSKGYAFSAFFNSSVSSSGTNPNPTNLTFARPPPPRPKASGPVPDHLVQYVGFTWGPETNAFDNSLEIPASHPNIAGIQTPLPMSKIQQSHFHVHDPHLGPFSAPPLMTAQKPFSALVTPIRPSSMHGLNHPPSTIRRTAGGTARKAGTTRAVSEAEALRQMGDCVRASARKRLSNHAGRTPGPGSSGALSSGLRQRASWVRMTLDFENVDASHREQDEADGGGGRQKGKAGAKASLSTRRLKEDHSTGGDDGGLRIFVKDRSVRPPTLHTRRSSSGGSLRGFRSPLGGDEDEYTDQSTGGILFGTVMRTDDEATSTTTDDAPPSPSPSPRPMSAMSRPTSSLSRRSIIPVQPVSSASISVGGLTGGSINASLGNPQRLVSLRRASTNASISGLHSAPSSTKIPPQEPVSIFKPPAPGSSTSRSASGSSVTPHAQIPTNGTKTGVLGRIVATDLDPDATPKAKLPSTSTRPIFIPPAPRFCDEIQPRHADTAQAHETRDKGKGVASAPRRETRAPNPDEVYPGPISGRVAPLNTAERQSSVDPKFAEMEERLRIMMKDIEQVEVGLQAARVRLEK